MNGVSAALAAGLVFGLIVAAHEGGFLGLVGAALCLACGCALWEELDLDLEDPDA